MRAKVYGQPPAAAAGLRWDDRGADDAPATTVVETAATRAAAIPSAKSRWERVRRGRCMQLPPPLWTVGDTMTAGVHLPTGSADVEILREAESSETSHAPPFGTRRRRIHPRQLLAL